MHALYMGRDAGAASFRDWKRAVDMKLSKRDDDLLYLVNHGERSALEERVLRELVLHLKQWSLWEKQKTLSGHVLPPHHDFCGSLPKHSSFQPPPPKIPPLAGE